MKRRVGALFAGYGGLELGIMMVFPDVELVWYSEIDPGACRVLAARFPGVPNLGDITKVDWAEVRRLYGPIDILAGGFPCQDLSDAGQKKGLRDGTRSGLWSEFARGIDQLRPALVIFENVRGLLSADAHSDLDCECCLAALGEDPPLRAHGAVLGDLATLRYDASWHGLRASEVGAPHGRFRVIGLGWPQESPPDPEELGLERLGDQGRGRAGLEDGAVFPSPRASDGVHGGPNQRGSAGDLTMPSVAHLLGTPTARDHKGVGPAGSDVHQWLVAHGSMEAQLLDLPDIGLLPTPGVAGGGKKIPDGATWSGKAAYKDDGTKVQVHLDQIEKLLPTPMANEGVKADTTQDEEDRGGHHVYLTNAVRGLLPTPTAVDMGSDKTPAEWDQWTEAMRERHHNGAGHGNSLNIEVQRLDADVSRWGKYAGAVARWAALTIDPPEPTEPGPSGQRLAPEFSEWMMGLPPGWVTDPRLWVGWEGAMPRNVQLQIIGNGVVPVQAAEGIRACLKIASMPVESAWDSRRQSKAWARVLRREARAK